MESISLNGNKRTERGTTAARAIRKENKVPCVIYGGKENIHFTVNELQFSKIIHTPKVYFINLAIDGTNFKAIIKDVQFHPVTDKPLHVDFLEVIEDKLLTVNIPIKITGTSKGVLNGGKLRIVTRKLKINGLPSALPESIEIDITKLKIGQTIKVDELNVDGITFLDAKNAVVVAVKTSRVAVDEDAEEEETEGSEETEAKTEEPATAEK